MLAMKPAHLAEKTRVAPLVAAFLLCFVVLLCAHQFAGITPGGALASPATEDSSHADSSTGSSGGLTQAGGNLPAFLEEAESSDEGPVNAENLTALLLMVFFGAALGLLYGGRMWRRDDALVLPGRRLASVTCCLPRQPSASRLSVFLL